MAGGWSGELIGRTCADMEHTSSSSGLDRRQSSHHTTPPLVRHDAPFASGVSLEQR
eukprot:TRINITY_DN16348_c0_g1_i1.p3 TRINITY_DN16348_c0_g1~~TRINITY_DN16348_c0_g1_i1.p3  ORF type:complete len:56 (-),score=0.92 TRINITY_DN16348_c0_g1_i1:78-245(-)